MKTTNPSKRCPVCSHVAIDKINALLLNPDKTLSTSQMLQWLKVHYPTEPVPSQVQMQNHRQRHIETNMSVAQIKALSIDRRTGTLVNERGRKVEAIGIVAAVKTIVTIGIANMLEDPKSITPSHTIEALKMLRALGIDDDDEGMMTWNNAVMQSPDEYLDDITTVIDVPESDQSEETSLPQDNDGQES